MKFLKDVLKKAWKNKWFKKGIIFLIVFAPLIIIDQVTKSQYFNGDKTGIPSGTISDIKIIAVRSQFHTSTTFLDFIGTSIPYWASLLIDYVLIVVFIALLIFSKNLFSTIAISITIGGIIGNTVDATFFHGVRNVFFIPWMDRGTFNFADLIIVIGAILTALSFIWNIFVNDKNKDTSQEEIVIKK